MRASPATLLLLLAAFTFVDPVRTTAQEPETRADVLRREREEKAQQLQPPQPGRMERLLLDLERGRFMERLLNPPEGLYPRIGNITAGSGISFGPGYRLAGLFGGHADVQTFAAASFSKYWMLDARLLMPRLASERVSIGIHGQRYEFPEQEFFGIGPTSNREDLVLYGLANTVIGATSAYSPARWLTVRGGVNHLSPRVAARSEPGSILTLFDDQQAPGVLSKLDFVEYNGSVEVNHRRPRGNPRSGGRYALTVQRYNELGGNRFSFTRTEADLQHYVPIVRDRRVLALRARATVTDAETGADVPFYLQPTLGGPDDLRGFRRFRFRDRHALLLQAEYRWEITGAVDGAIFYDAGAVAPRLEDLSLDRLESDYGIGFRFGNETGVFLRIEGAFGSSGGKHFIFRFGHVF